MNKQDQIQDMIDYGFSEAEAAAQLSTDKSFVTSAVEGNPNFMSITGHAMDQGRIGSYTDKTMDMYELLHKYDAKRINSVIKIDGLRSAARYFDVDVTVLFKLKVHFGYHKPLPYNALNKIAYFTDKQRDDIKRRDKGLCVRCSHEATRFFKIDATGLPVVDNSAMVCDYCMWRRMTKHTKNNKNVFKDMRHTEFITWIKENDPYKPISRKSANG